MRVNILFDITYAPFGGGNQFLRNLRDELIRRDLYTNSVEEADVILFNSHHKFEDVINYRKQFPNKTFIHRVDGPMSLYNPPYDHRDDLVKILSTSSDGTVFQSNWSESRNILTTDNFKMKPFTVIHNAAIVDIKNIGRLRNDKRVHLVSTSFSDNMNKGFAFYKYLDENLDFSKYRYIFIGNSPIGFRNIEHLSPMRTDDLLREVSYNDIFITASINDPCSNSLIEALSCGLPAVALSSGGHPEIVKDGGELFVDKYNMISKIDKVSKRIDTYRNKISVNTIEECASEYIKFFEKVYNEKH